MHPKKNFASQDISASSFPRGLRIQQAAEYAGTNCWFIRSAIWTGKLKAHHAGKTIIILRDDLDRFLNSLPEVEPNTSDWLKQRQPKTAPRRQVGVAA